MKLVITFTDIHNENDPEELFSIFKRNCEGLTESQLIEFAKELISQKSEHWPQRHGIYLTDKDVLLHEGEIVIFREEFLDYHKMLVALVSMIYFMDEEMKRRKFIIDLAHHINAKDKEIASRFSKDIAESVYYEFKGG